ncbi:hypothetical protein BAU15_11890 [Enterococcus sp. JM4C]|uniref:hypothetical protein n=1 Tax=Candidatus Enterococcus huntleyi TaxID=1857217 RepID=UPI00137941F3|nr:hypothetical protein [Enterococcus sp. JM4C]KAF1298450.1 hypothetical protein BAU15_11890 [Enterococcus sp. JM4C]
MKNTESKSENMKSLLLDRALLEEQQLKSSIWAVPIKPYLNKKARELQKSEPNKYKELVKAQASIKRIIEKVINNVPLTAHEQADLKIRVLGDWPINKENAEGIETLVAVYYHEKKQVVIAIYEVSATDIIEVSNTSKQQRRRWLDGQAVDCLRGFEEYKLPLVIDQLSPHMNRAQKLFFKK